MNKQKYLTGGYNNLKLTVLAIYHKADKKISLLFINHEVGYATAKLAIGTRKDSRVLAVEQIVHILSSWVITEFDEKVEHLDYIQSNYKHKTPNYKVLLSSSLATKTFYRNFSKFSYIDFISFNWKNTNLPNIVKDALIIYNSHTSVKDMDKNITLVNNLIQSRMRNIDTIKNNKSNNK